MRSRWFHRPELHVQGATRKKVTWLELLFDLVWVVALVQLGDALAERLSSGGGIDAYVAFVGHFLPLALAWTGFTFFENRFDVDDLVHRGAAFLHMAAVATMGVTARAAMDGTDPRPASFALAFATSQALVAAVHVRTAAQVPASRAYSAWWGGVFGAGAAIWAVSALLPAPACWVLWSVGILLLIASPAARRSRALADELPFDQAHLDDRFGMLVLFVLGGAMLDLLDALGPRAAGADTRWWIGGAAAFAVLLSLWWIYFDDVAGSRVRGGRFAWVLWLTGHLPLGLSIASAGVALQLTVGPVTAADDVVRALLGGALGGAFLSVALIDAVTEREGVHLDDRWRVRVRTASAVLLLLLAAGGHLPPLDLLFVAAVIGASQALFDVVIAPLQTQDTTTAVSTAELARRRAAGETGATRPMRIGQAVRRGAPSMIRSDLYFWLMSGGWGRLLGFLGASFFVTNLFFAAVYMLRPTSIGGMRDGTFFDAFAFSVQTLGTIGYGVMHPGDRFGDTVVFVESVVGTLLVALATGLMFAKASRPTSKVLWSKVLTVTRWNGRPTLQFRVGNAAGNEVVDASMTVSVLMDEVTPEGHHLRRLQELTLVRPRSQLFTLTWLVQHVIDETSPLAGLDWSAPSGRLLGFIATMVGHDATYGQTTYARNMWRPDDVRPGTRFVDVMSELPDGRLVIDYAGFHDTEPDPFSTSSSSS